METIAELNRGNYPRKNEILEFSHQLKQLKPVREIKEIAVQEGMMTLRQSGLIKIKEGITSVEEVLRETVKDGEIRNDKNNS